MALLSKNKSNVIKQMCIYQSVWKTQWRSSMVHSVLRKHVIGCRAANFSYEMKESALHAVVTGRQHVVRFLSFTTCRQHIVLGYLIIQISWNLVNRENYVDFKGFWWHKWNLTNNLSGVTYLKRCFFALKQWKIKR